MNFLKKIFGGGNQKNSDHIIEKSAITDNHLNNVPLEDLFIENQPPQLNNFIPENEKGKLGDFLARNFQHMGETDGYDFHSKEILESSERKIRAEFQLIADQVIQEKSERRLQLMNSVIDVTNVSDSVTQQLENSIDELNHVIALLQRQKELSAENEGWVMTAIHGYRIGFEKGLREYLAFEKLLNIGSII